MMPAINSARILMGTAALLVAACAAPDHSSEIDTAVEANHS
ncbi:MAG: hypothetical protein ACI9F9_001426, partial [Candidatus Paceibacteria bacterium]